MPVALGEGHLHLLALHGRGQYRPTMSLAAATTGDLTQAWILLLVMIVVSFTAGYGVAYMRLVKRHKD